MIELESLTKSRAGTPQTAAAELIGSSYTSGVSHPLLYTRVSGGLYTLPSVPCTQLLQYFSREKRKEDAGELRRRISTPPA